MNNKVIVNVPPSSIFILYKKSQQKEDKNPKHSSYERFLQKKRCLQKKCL